MTQVGAHGVGCHAWVTAIFNQLSPRLNPVHCLNAALLSSSNSTFVQHGKDTGRGWVALLSSDKEHSELLFVKEVSAGYQQSSIHCPEGCICMAGMRVYSDTSDHVRAIYTNLHHTISYHTIIYHTTIYYTIIYHIIHGPNLLQTSRRHCSQRLLKRCSSSMLAPRLQKSAAPSAGRLGPLQRVVGFSAG